MLLAVGVPRSSTARLFVLETPWDRDIRSALSVGPFLAGLKEALGIDVVPQRFNGKNDLVFYLNEFSRRNSEFSHCYVACHGTSGRLQPLLKQQINAATIADACRGSRGRGFIIGGCSFGNYRTAATFLERTGASFVAGYAADVPWMESMLVDLMFLTYLLGGRRLRTRAAFGYVPRRGGERAGSAEGDPLTSPSLGPADSDLAPFVCLPASFWRRPRPASSPRGPSSRRLAAPGGA